MPLWRDVRVLKWVVQLAIVAVVVAIASWLWGNYTDECRAGEHPDQLRLPRQPGVVPDHRELAVAERVGPRGAVPGAAEHVAGLGRRRHRGDDARHARRYRPAVAELDRAQDLDRLRRGGAQHSARRCSWWRASWSSCSACFPNITDAWDFLGVVILSNRGIAVPWFQGGTGRGLLLILLVGAVVWWAVARWRRSVSNRTGTPARSGLWGGLAFLVIVVGCWFAAGYSWSVPAIEGRATSGGMRVDPSFFALFFALVIYTASHIAEIVRGSIQAVPRGQAEAADAVALSGFQKMWFVILPQALRIGIPPLGNQYLNLIKNSSLGAAIGYYGTRPPGSGRPLEPLQTFDTKGRVVYVGSFSKTMLPTLRLGFLVTPPSLRRPCTKRNSSATGIRRHLRKWHSRVSSVRARLHVTSAG